MTKHEPPIEDTDEPTLENHPGLDNDEATAAGKVMTASGSIGPETGEGDEYEKVDDGESSTEDDRESTEEAEHRQEFTQPWTADPGRRRGTLEIR